MASSLFRAVIMAALDATGAAETQAALGNPAIIVRPCESDTTMWTSPSGSFSRPSTPTLESRQTWLSIGAVRGAPFLGGEAVRASMLVARTWASIAPAAGCVRV